MTEYTIDMIKGTTVMEQMRSLIKVVIEFINEDEGDIEEVRQMIQTEIADRTAQDGQLQLQIQEEVGARADQDLALSSQIQVEAEARAAQDNDLSTRIQAEATARENQDEDLYDRVTIDIEFEQRNRENADNALETAITSETSQRETADTTLQGNINSEAQTRFDADSSLYNDIQQIILGQSVAQVAAKLQTARNIQVALGSSVGADFDGSADVTPGVSGVLPIQNGGTGGTTGHNTSNTLSDQIALNNPLSGTISVSTKNGICTITQNSDAQVIAVLQDAIASSTTCPTPVNNYVATVIFNQTGQPIGRAYIYKTYSNHLRVTTTATGVCNFSMTYTIKE